MEKNMNMDKSGCCTSLNASSQSRTHRNIITLACSLIVTATHCLGQVGHLPAAFDAISGKSTEYSMANATEFNDKGGHIQGAQWLLYEGTAYVLLSGSSNNIAYCATARLDDHARIVHIDTLSTTPYRHAGGFQICGDLLAVGVEDNYRKDRSKILMYKIEDPARPLSLPLVTIDRQGAPERATAGCVGIVRTKDRYFVAVGDWDTKHIDFYTCSSAEPLSRSSSFALVSTINTERTDKSRWINDQWLAYQNINLFADAEGQIYLIGTATNNEGEDIADLYLLPAMDGVEFDIRKIDSKNFGRNPQNRFRWGVGVSYSDRDGLLIIATEDHIRDRGNIRIYR
jgi:hypothetical protein